MNNNRIIIESLAFENGNAKCKRILRPLKARSAPIEDWIHETVTVHLYNDENLVRELISRGPRTSPNIRCFNCGMPGHIKETVNKAFKETIPLLGIIQIEFPSLLGYAEGVAKGGIGLVNVDQQGTDKVTFCPW